MSAFASHELARRAGLAGWFLGLALVVLCAAFFNVQILDHERYATTSAMHRLRPLPLTAPRGDIVDRNGLPIALSLPGYSIKVLADSEAALRRVVQEMVLLVPNETIDVEEIVKLWKPASFRPVVVIRAGTDTTVAVLEEHRAALPGLVIENEPKRSYPAGAAVAHLLGYIGEISQAEIDRGSFGAVVTGELVGKDGLEAEYDSLLRGRRGIRYVEVTANGHVVRNPTAIGLVPPQAGTALQTTIDLPLQLFIDSMWRAAMPDKAGAMVAMTPDGQILAYASFPSFDPNAFISPANPVAVRAALADPHKPMFNRVIAAQYPPASPWKLVMAIMALKRNVATMGTRMPVPCTGGYQLGNRYYACWDAKGHGSLTLAEAIAYSCDVYFYQLGLKLGRDAILEDGVAYGFRAKSGIDLERETSSGFPSAADYIKKRGAVPGNGEVLNLAIGQGMNKQSLINMTSFFAALASDGIKRPPFLYQPRSGAPVTDFGLSSDQLAGLRAALASVVSGGTAAASGGRGLQVAGKTGTGQMTGQKNLGWFIGFAPYDAPKVVIGIVVEEGIHGSSVAGYVVNAIGKFLGMDGKGITIPVTENLTAPPDTTIIPDTLSVLPQFRLRP